MLAERVRRTVPDWRLDDAAQQEVLCRWMRASVKDAEPILERRGLL